LAESFAPIAAKWQGGDKSGAIDGFMRLVEGPDWRKAIDTIAGAWQMAIADADTVFQLEGQALQEWPFGIDDAWRIKVPVLAMLGAAIVPMFHETHELACSWFAHSEPVVIRGATHMLQMVKPRAVAEALSGFLSRHPIRA
jgi:pimeloyl-ACP methyl ester carboxylesterase